MARARNIKPGFFTNDVLAECSALARILFQGLWCHADREGRLEDRPRKLKAEILPYDECDTEELLCQLESRGFIVRYSHGADRFIQVVNFCKHQNPHVKEQESTIPAQCTSGAKPEVAGLIPDSLNPITDSSEQPLPGASLPVADKPEKVETELQAVCRQTWAAYADAYETKYSTKPVRNAKVSAQVRQFVQRIGQDESLSIAEWFVSHPGDFYAKNLHSFGLLLNDAEKLRTQWATGRIVNQQTGGYTPGFAERRDAETKNTLAILTGRSPSVDFIERDITGKASVLNRTLQAPTQSLIERDITAEVRHVA